MSRLASRDDDVTELSEKVDVKRRSGARRMAPSDETNVVFVEKALLIDAKVVPTVVAEWLEEAFKGH